MNRLRAFFNTKGIKRILWAAFLVTLPVTSFPFFPPAFGGEALVRPLSLYPLSLLVLLVIIPRLIKKPLPGNLLALLPFVLVAVASSLLSLLRGIEPALGISVTARVARGLDDIDDRQRHLSGDRLAARRQKRPALHPALDLYWRRFCPFMGLFAGDLCCTFRPRMVWLAVQGPAIHLLPAFASRANFGFDL